MPTRELQRIDTNGVTLETVVEGDGPLVILLHGWPQCWYLWRHQIDPIVDAGFRVAVLDFLRGRVLPIDEQYVNHWNHDPWRLDQGGAGQRLSDGASFLLPYYMGLYHGFIVETE